jgi:hypothetical protein
VGYAPSSPLFIFLSFGYQKKEKRTKKKENQQVMSGEESPEPPLIASNE